MLDNQQITFFKTALELKRDKIQKNLNLTSLEMDEMNQNDLKDEGDHASMALANTVDNAILAQQARELTEIKLALDKIQEKIYGTCEMCEEEINVERLKVKIFARYCITCREVVEKRQK